MAERALKAIQSMPQDPDRLQSTLRRQGAIWIGGFDAGDRPVVDEFRKREGRLPVAAAACPECRAELANMRIEKIGRLHRSELVPHRVTDDIHNRMRIQLAHNGGAMRLHGFQADRQRCGDLLVAFPFRKQLEDFPLPTGEGILRRLLLTSNLAQAKEWLRAIAPLKVRWVSQASINAAHDEEFLELLVRQATGEHPILRLPA